MQSYETIQRCTKKLIYVVVISDVNLCMWHVIYMQVEFPPDLCSRVTFVNFTVTRSSLQSQCLNEVLKAERPDVDEKRSDLLKLQGETKSGRCINRMTEHSWE